MENVKTKIYLMEDSHGNRTAVVVEDSSSGAMVHGMHGRENELLHFESDAYHLPTWCAEHDIELRIADRSEPFAELWDSVLQFEVGERVYYCPDHAKNNRWHADTQTGTVSSVTGKGSAQKVWVRFTDGDTGALTPLKNLLKD